MKTKLNSSSGICPWSRVLLAALGLSFTLLTAHAQPNWGMALAFDGVDDYVSLGSATNVTLAGPWTAEFWVNRQDSPDAAAVLLSGGSTGLRLEQTGTARRVGFSSNGATHYAFNYTAPTNTWVHLALVSDTTTRLYVNGVAQDTNANTIALTLGQLGSLTNRFKGSLDEVRVWNMARSEAQIQSTMNQPLAGNEPGLVAYYRFDEAAGITAYDATTNHLNGKLINRPVRVPSYWSPYWSPVITLNLKTAVDP